VANALNTKRLENKIFWQKAPKNKNSRVLHTKKYIQQRAMTLVDLNHLLQGDSSNGARGKTQHPLEAI
jgi:hypothetical protein